MNTNTPLSALRLAIQEQIALVPMRDYVTLNLLSKESDFQSQVKWNVNVGGGTATGRATNANAVAATTDATVNASLPIGDAVIGHRFDIIVNDLVQAQQAGVGALKQLFKYQAKNGLEVVLKKLNQALYTGAGTNADGGVYGMEYIKTQANDYANISVTSYPTWVPYLNTNASNRALTEALLYTTTTEMRKKGGSPDVIIGSLEMIDTFSKLTSSVRTFNIAAPTRLAELGFSMASWQGIPLVGDVDCTANTLYFVRSSGVSLHTFSLASGSPLIGGAIQADQANGINLLIAQIPSQAPHVFSYELSVQPQLQVFNRAKDLAVLEKISY